MRGFRHARLGAALVVATVIAAACASGDDGALVTAPDATRPTPSATTGPPDVTGTTAATPAPAPAPPPPADVLFTSDGDVISGWYWLRDDEGRQYGQWVFRDTGNEGAVELSLELLATDAADGGPGFPARFWLSYGPAGDEGLFSAVGDPLLVELPNVSPPSDAVGYTTRDTITVPMGVLPSGADGIWVQITRRGPDGQIEPYHVAVRDASVTATRIPDCDPLAADVAEVFISDGDVISGWYWLRDDAGQQYGQWVFRDTIDTGTFELNLELLATDTVDGGAGFPARFWLTYGAAGDDGASGLGPAADEPLFVELPNVSPDSDPVGYTTRGTVTVTTGALPNWADGIWVQITRAGPDGTLERGGDVARGGTAGGVEPNHIAVRESSVTIAGTACEDGGGSDGTLPPSTTSPDTLPPSTTTATTLPDESDEADEADLEDLPPMVISLGDSYISGEAGRWAGNTYALLDFPFTDALGSDAYDDGPGGELISGCHRSDSAAIHIGTAEDGTRVASLNLACSGARTYTQPDDDKPGVDRCTSVQDATESNQYEWVGGAPVARPYNCKGVTGQVELLAQTLEEVEGEYHVEMVDVSIGGNNFEFGDIVTQCVEDFLSSRIYLGCTCVLRAWGHCILCVPFYGEEDHCNDDQIASEVTSSENLASREAEITAALQDIRDVMAEAGYTDDDWTLLVNTYPSPVPNSDEFRYAETGYSRFYDGGCGFWDEDADWANDTALANIAATINAAVDGLEAGGATNVEVLDLTAAFDDRRLCEAGVGQVGPEAIADEAGVVVSWTAPAAVDLSEWVQQIRGVVSTGGALDIGPVDLGPFDKDESLHPNYWGQLALRSCVRQAYNNGAPIGGSCVRAGTGLTSRDEPLMDVTP